MKSDINLWVDEMVKRHGWYIHFDLLSVDHPYNVNMHTHGLSKYDHIDFQICFPLTKEDAYTIFLDIANKIQKGRKFRPAIKYMDILIGHEVEFAEAKEDGRVVLRIILPDKDGNLRGELKDQWKGCRTYFINN